MSHLASINLDTLYRDHSPWLVGWLTPRARCHSRAQDLAQETFCRLAAHAEVQFEHHPRRYLVAVARRLLIDDGRRRTTERAGLDTLSLQVSRSEQPGPDRILEASETLAAVALLLHDLSPRARKAFLLSRLDGLTYAEIAAELGVSKSMVKQYVAKAFAHCYVIAHGGFDD